MFESIFCACDARFVGCQKEMEDEPEHVNPQSISFLQTGSYSQYMSRDGRMYFLYVDYLISPLPSFAATESEPTDSGHEVYRAFIFSLRRLGWCSDSCEHKLNSNPYMSLLPDLREYPRLVEVHWRPITSHPRYIDYYTNGQGPLPTPWTALSSPPLPLDQSKLPYITPRCWTF